MMRGVELAETLQTIHGLWPHVQRRPRWMLGPHVDVYDDDYDCDVHGDDDDKKVVRGPH